MLVPKDMTVKRQSKNSVFVSFFNDERNVLQFYKELHPEAVDLTVDDIKIDTLESVIVNTLYNDLGFIVRDRYVLLVEAQSTWNENIALRMLFYLSETFRRYLNDTEQSELDEKRVQLPCPEMYVIYSGNGKKPEVMSLSEDFFGGRDDIELRVRVLSEVNQTLSGQYIGFCKVFDEQRRLYNNGIRAAKETYRICIENGYLTDYMRSHEMEVVDMMSELFDEETMRRQLEIAHRRRDLETGAAIGKELGMREGKEEQKIKIAKELLADGTFNNEKISKLTGLSLDKVNELANKLQENNC